MAHVYELMVVDGPLTGRRFRVDPGERTRIGRASREVPLFQDELASLEHADLTFERGRWRIVDVGSQTGTWVNGVRVPPGGVRLAPGDVIRVGGTVLRLEVRETVPPWVGWSLAVGTPVVVTAFVLLLVAIRPVSYEPVVVFPEPVAQGDRASPRLEVPRAFIRAFALDHRGIAPRRVTDFDGDGRSELWLRRGDEEIVVEVSATEGWSLLGRIPRGCDDREGEGFPDLACRGFVYRWLDGRYVPVALDGAVAWLSGRGEEEGDPPPRPYRVHLVHPERLAGFLADRGIAEAVHYLVCEGALPGVRAQVLTASGDLRLLEPGCVGALRVEGPGLGPDLAPEAPAAVAFTAAGHRALVDDAMVYVSGGRDGLFVADEDRPLATAWTAPVQTRVARLAFDAPPVEGPSPIAPEARLGGIRHLVGRGPRPPPVLAVSIDSPGVAEFDPPGCARIRVEARSFHCLLRRGCTPGRTFLTATEIGCGAPIRLLDVPYSGGRRAGATGDVGVRAVVDVVGESGRIDVLRARIAFREPWAGPGDAASERGDPR